MANPQYICSLTSHFILSLSPYFYPFPSLSLIISPISPISHFHFPHFPLIPPSFSHISHPRCTFRLFPILPLIPSHSPHNRVQSTYTDLTPSATRFPTPTHTCSCTHVVRSRIHILTFSCSPTNHISIPYYST